MNFVCVLAATREARSLFETKRLNAAPDCESYRTTHIRTINQVELSVLKMLCRNGPMWELYPLKLA